MEDDDKQVNHPSHYCSGKREVIELTEQLDFCFGNACKYILRAPFKGQEIRDLKKARWYIQRLIDAGVIPELGHNTMSVYKDYESPLLEEVIEAVLSAAVREQPILMKAAVTAINNKIREVEYHGLQKEVRRLREEMRQGREVWQERLLNPERIFGTWR